MVKDEENSIRSVQGRVEWSLIMGIFEEIRAYKGGIRRECYEDR